MAAARDFPDGYPDECGVGYCTAASLAPRVLRTPVVGRRTIIAIGACRNSVGYGPTTARRHCTAAVEPLRQGLAVQEQLLLRACCSASREGVSGTFVFWEEALSNRQARHAKRGALLHWADYKRWFQHTVMESQKLRLRRLFWALRPVSQPQEHRDLRDRLALRNAQRTAQRCLRELHVRFLRQRKALRARQLQLQRQCFTAMAQWQLLRYAFECLAGRSDTPRALPEFSDVLLVKG